MSFKSSFNKQKHEPKRNSSNRLSEGRVHHVHIIYHVNAHLNQGGRIIAKIFYNLAWDQNQAAWEINHFLWNGIYMNYIVNNDIKMFRFKKKQNS